jgi:hypothetical protein
MTLHAPNLDLEWLTDCFNGISLEDLNAKAGMMARMDNKYVLRRSELKRVMPELAKRFDILDIDQRRIFTYDTRYFDDAGRSAYQEHHQGRRQGFKVRVRRYADAGLCFLEVKVKGLRGMTVKHRIPYNPAQSGYLTNAAVEFARNVYSDHYGKPFGYRLQWAMDVRYKRITLVAGDGGERMTIDTDLQYWSSKRSLSLGTDVFIVETKSDQGRGFADKCLRNVHERPLKKCSKYCLGMAALGEVSRYNLFMPTMRKLGMIGQEPADQQMLACA